MLPTFEPVEFGVSPPVLNFYAFAEAALAGLVLGHVDEFDSACFTSAMLVIALMGEASPAPVPTGESFLVIETHICWVVLVPFDPQFG